MSDSALLTGGPLPLPHKCISLKWYFLYSAHRSLTPTPVPISLGTSPPTLAFFFQSTSLLFTLRRSQPPSSDPFPPAWRSLSITLLPLYDSPSTHLPFPRRCTSVSLCSRLPFPLWWLMAEGSSMEYRSV